MSFQDEDKKQPGRRSWNRTKYTYDKNGNRTCKEETSPATTYSYTSGTNRLSASLIGEGGTSYDYDANGSMTNDGTHTYDYNKAGRLATVDGAGTAIYTYDGDNRRVIKSTVSGTTYYFYDPAGRLLTEMRPNVEGGTATGKDYLYLPDAVVARVDWAVIRPSVQCPPHTDCDPLTGNDALFYYHTDHLGTPIAMTDDSSEPVWRAEYLPFGELFSNTVTTVQNNLRFPGQYFDYETGLHQNWFRDYASKTGRYQEADPIGLWGGSNLYAYAEANPANWFDVMGLDPLEIIFWAPVGGGRSSFGHVSERIGDMSYSFGENGNDVHKFAEYRLRQWFRNGHGLVIDVPSESMTRIEQLLHEFDEDYGNPKVNCTTPIQQALGNEFGFARPGTPSAWQGSVLPLTLEQAIRRNFNVIDTTFYPKIPRPTK